MKYSWDEYYTPTDDAAYEHDWKDLPMPGNKPIRQNKKCPSHENHKKGACSWGIIPDAVAKKYPPPDTQSANHAVNKLNKWDQDSEVQNFFMAVGFHKPHLPFICPQKYFDLYPKSAINLPQNPDPPENMPTVCPFGIFQSGFFFATHFFFVH